MDPAGIVAIITALGVFFNQIVNHRETKRRLVIVEAAQAECLKRDQQRELELVTIRAEAKTVSHLEDILQKQHDSNRRWLKLEIDGVTRAIYDTEKRRVVHIEKAKNPGDTVGDA